MESMFENSPGLDYYDEREELIDKLVSLEPRLYYHNVSSTGVEYCDERCSPLLIISQAMPPDIRGFVQWRFEFIETGEVFAFTENINEAFEDEDIDLV
jgi:hypothetical protein